jgi:hypothetical protein
MDRTRIATALDGALVVAVQGLDPESLGGLDVVVVDLTAAGALATIEAARTTAGPVRIVAFGPHIDAAGLGAARTAGADEVLPRSQFFRDVRLATLGPVTDR